MNELSARQGKIWRIAGWGFAVALLLTPAIAMQFSDEVRWAPGDFIIFGLMLLVAGLAVEIIVRTLAKGPTRWLGVLVIAGLFLWLWAELAVGVLTDWGS